MRIRNHLLGGTALAALMVMAASVAALADSMKVGEATVTVGGGVALLTLPDIRFTLIENNAFRTTAKQKNSEIDDEYGWNINGAVEAPLQGWVNAIAVHGFYANIEDTDSVFCNGVAGSVRCGWAPIINAVGKVGFGGGDDTTVRTEREVDHWGVAVELKRYRQPGGLKDPQPAKRRYVAVGADFRTIDQDIFMRGNEVQDPTNFFTYSEDLEARYYGAYLAYGGDYTPFLFKGLWRRWGLQSSFRLQGGLYHVDTDYSGVFTDLAVLGITQTLNLSSDDVAFIGGLTLETRKQIGPRTALSLQSVYEYYSWVPDMIYNDVAPGGPGFNNGTSIGDDDAFSARTSLRLTIGLGPRQLYEEPPPPLK